MTQEIKFIKEETFHYQEGQYVEFKEIKSEKPLNKIVDHAEQYIIGFINALGEGDIYLGIDDAGKILGINLSRSLIDEMQKRITDKLTNVQPALPPSCYTVYPHPVYDTEDKKINDLYIVQIHTSKIEEDYLFRTSNGSHWLYQTGGESHYLKKESSCIKLEGERFAQEIKFRHQRYLRKELEKINRSLEKDADNISLLKKKAEIAKFMGDIETMEETYEKLIILNPSNSKTRFAYASARKSIGDLEGALSTIHDALQFDKNDFDLLKAQGEILFIANRTDEALKSYQDALKLNQDDYTILTQIGITFRELGKYKESIKFFNYALLKSPNYRAAKYEKKKTYSKMFQGGIRINTIS